jgi:hypothetical protein
MCSKRPQNAENQHEMMLLMPLQLTPAGFLFPFFSKSLIFGHVLPIDAGADIAGDIAANLGFNLFLGEALCFAGTEEIVNECLYGFLSSSHAISLVRMDAVLKPELNKFFCGCHTAL